MRLAALMGMAQSVHGLPQVSSLLLVLISYQLPCPSPIHDNDGIEVFLPAVDFHPFADCISKHISFLST